jgi:hypothetical protein
LHEFINSFITSSLPPKTSGYSLEGEEDTPAPSDTASIYADNFSHLFPFTASALGPTQSFKPDGLYEVVLYLCVRVFKVGDTVLRLLYSVKWLLEASTNHIVNYCLATKLDSLLNHTRVSYIIDVIQESIFAPEKSIADEEYKYIADLTLKHFRNYLPNVLRTISSEGFETGTDDIFQAFQDPWLNKQLVYTLLDTVLHKLFPELRN